MGTFPEDKAVGDEMSAAEVNDIRDGAYTVDANAGETINGGTLPVPVYFDNTANELMACDANDQDKLEFVGFAISNSTNGSSIQFQKSGIVDGFSGLTVGETYYVQDAVGTIGTTIGTYEVKVGIAISATQILIVEGSFEYMGSAADSADSITVPAGARFAIINLSWNNTAVSSNGIMEIFLDRNGKTSGTVQFFDTAGAGVGDMSATASWSGSTITLSYGGVADSVSGTAYFYR